MRNDGPPWSRRERLGQFVCLCPRSSSAREPICLPPEPYILQCLWPRARQQARPRSARRSDASRSQRGRCLFPLPSRAMGSSPVAPRELGWMAPHPGPMRLPNLGPHTRTPLTHTGAPTPTIPGPLPSLLFLIANLPPSEGPHWLPRKQPHLRFPGAPPPPPRELSDWPVKLGLSPSRRLLLCQRLGANGRQGTAGPILIGERVRGPSLVIQKGLREEWEEGLWRLLAGRFCAFRIFSRLRLPFIMFYPSEEAKESQDRHLPAPVSPTLPFPAFSFSLVPGAEGTVRGSSHREEAAFFYPVSRHLPLIEFNSVPRSLSRWYLNFLPRKAGILWKFLPGEGGRVQEESGLREPADL